MAAFVGLGSPQTAHCEVHVSGREAELLCSLPCQPAEAFLVPGGRAVVLICADGSEVEVELDRRVPPAEEAELVRVRGGTAVILLKLSSAGGD